jgi:hypothetical protein
VSSFAAPAEVAPAELPPALSEAALLVRPMLAATPQPGAAVVLVEIEAQGGT